MSVSTYPVALNLTAKRCLVVGAGALAREKVEGLLRAGATVRCVGPEPGDDADAWKHPHRNPRLERHPRPYTPSDLDGVYLAYGASEDRALNARVAQDARRRGVIVNAVDDIPNCDFFAMALVRRGDLQIAISTNGRSPAFARWMRERLQGQVPVEFGDLLAALGQARDAIRARGEVPPYEGWARAIAEELAWRATGAPVEGTAERLLTALTAVGRGATGGTR